MVHWFFWCIWKSHFNLSLVFHTSHLVLNLLRLSLCIHLIENCLFIQWFLTQKFATMNFKFPSVKAWFMLGDLSGFKMFSRCHCVKYMHDKMISWLASSLLWSQPMICGSSLHASWFIASSLVDRTLGVNLKCWSLCILIFHLCIAQREVRMNRFCIWNLAQHDLSNSNLLGVVKPSVFHVSVFFFHSWEVMMWCILNFSNSDFSWELNITSVNLITFWISPRTAYAVRGRLNSELHGTWIFFPILNNSIQIVDLAWRLLEYMFLLPYIYLVFFF